VILGDIRPYSVNQKSLFDTQDDTKSEQLMIVLDSLNNKHGEEILKFASCGTHKHWKMKSEARSPRYTTKWDELLKASC